MSIIWPLSFLPRMNPNHPIFGERYQKNPHILSKSIDKKLVWILLWVILLSLNSVWCGKIWLLKVQIDLLEGWEEKGMTSHPSLDGYKSVTGIDKLCYLHTRLEQTFKLYQDWESLWFSTIFIQTRLWRLLFIKNR